MSRFFHHYYFFALYIIIFHFHSRNQRKMYSLVVNGISDINELSRRLKLRYKPTIKMLQKLIYFANHPKEYRNLQWIAFANAHIDFGRQLVLLTRQTDGLVTCMPYNDAFTFWVNRIAG